MSFQGEIGDPGPQGLNGELGEKVRKCSWLAKYLSLLNFSTRITRTMLLVLLMKHFQIFVGVRTYKLRRVFVV